METKKCNTCGNDYFAYGIGDTCYKCVDREHRERENRYPFVVHYGSDFDEFETKEAAEKFLSELHSAYIEER